MRTPTAAATLAAALMIAAQVGGKATRDALFLSSYPASELPKAMLASAVLSALGVLATAQGMARLGPARLVPALFALGAVLHGGEWWLLRRAPAMAAVVVYLHVAALGSLLVSGFWTVVSERYDPRTARQVIGNIGTGATLGGLAGGVIAERVASWLEAPAMLLVLAGMSVLAAVAVAAVGAPSTPASQRDRREPESESAAAPLDAGGEPAVRVGDPIAGLRHLGASAYLRQLGWLAMLTALVAGVLDFVFKAQASAAFPRRESLMSFFAVFYTATGLFTVIVQSALSKRALSRLGIAGTLTLLPGAVLLTGVLGLAVLRLWSVVLARAAEVVLRNSLFRSGYELLFTPVDPERKRATKTVIDVGFDRLGDALASSLLMVVLLLAPVWANAVALGVGVGAALVTLIVAVRMHGGYVEELAASLRSGRVRLRDSDVIDATTRRTLAETTHAIDRAKLLAQIDELRRERSAGTEAGAAAGKASRAEIHLAVKQAMAETLPEAGAAPAPVDPTPTSRQDLARAAAELLSGDPTRVAQILEGSVDPRLAALVIAELGSPQLGRAARRALVGMAPRIVGQLTDALLDATRDLAVCARVADVIKKVESERAVAGLVAGLGDERALVRQRCALGLAELSRRAPALRPPPERILEAVDRELGAGAGVDLDHVFVLLGLVLDPEPLRLAYRALHADDQMLRGTSLEYLENVLPERTRAALWPRIERLAGGAVSLRRPDEPPRSRAEIVADLHRSMELRIDVAAPAPPAED
jgi:hypothetical protein